MTTRRVVVGMVFAFGVQVAVWSPSLGANDSSATSAVSNANLIERLDRLETRMTDLESQLTTLRREKTAVQENLRHQQEVAAQLKAQRAHQTESVAVQPLASASADPSEDRPRPALVDSWGVRTGYQGFPFGQKEGGFYYGIFVDHQLLSQEEGMPGGDVDLEVGAGVGTSGDDQVTVRSSVVGRPVNVDFRQRMISIWPGAKYGLNLWKSYGFVPYVTAGPGIWVDIIETPPLTGGLQFPTKALAERKVPEIASASLFQGAQGGAGFEYSLAGFKSEIFQRMKIGFDYRYSAWTTGQRFNTYSLLLSYSN
jgi:hypothetical protein